MQGLFLIDDPRSGVENMALDQRMLELAAKFNYPLLRIYRWARPTLSLGYFQKYAERLTHSPSSPIEVVRRATGGGAIVHHHDWTYSLAIPSTLLTSKSTSSSKQDNRFATGASEAMYTCVHAAVVQWLEEHGLPAELWNGVCNVPSRSQTDNEPKAKCSFLCFERRSNGDVVAANSKVLGSAQRRLHGAAVQNGALLQHGSLLLMRSSYAPSLSGLRELGASCTFSSDDLLSFALRICDAVAAFTQTRFERSGSLGEFLPGWLPPPKRELPSWTGKR